MLYRNSGPTKAYSFLVTIELEDGVTSPETIMNRLSDAVSFMDGCSVLDVENFGTIDEASAQDE